MRPRFQRLTLASLFNNQLVCSIFSNPNPPRASIVPADQDTLIMTLNPLAVRPRVTWLSYWRNDDQKRDWIIINGAVASRSGILAPKIQVQPINGMEWYAMAISSIHGLDSVLRQLIADARATKPNANDAQILESVEHQMTYYYYAQKTEKFKRVWNARRVLVTVPDGFVTYTNIRRQPGLPG